MEVAWVAKSSQNFLAKGKDDLSEVLEHYRNYRDPYLEGAPSQQQKTVWQESGLITMEVCMRPSPILLTSSHTKI